MDRKFLLHEMLMGSKHMIIIGTAGSGKTYLINRFLQHSVLMPDLQVLAVAPTALAASNFHGSTIHAAFGFYPSIVLPHEVRTHSYLTFVNVLLIDEISMVSCDVLDGIDVALRRTKSNDLPFGGVRLILIGDPYQLGPVIKTENQIKYFQLYGEDKHPFYFFNSKSFIKIDHPDCLDIYNLSGSFRHRSNSPFKYTLDRIRTGEATQEDLTLINKNLYKLSSGNSIFGKTIITTKRDQAQAYNTEALAQIDGQPFTLIPKIIVHIKQIDNILDETDFPQPVTAKIGCDILWTKNKRQYGLINGSRLSIIDIDRNKDQEIETLHFKRTTEKEFGKLIILKPQNTDFYYPEYDEKRKKLYSVCYASAVHFPIIPAYAITVHKSQGVTLNSVVYDKGSNSFAYGQTYTALSRVRSLSGLELMHPIDLSDILVSEDVVHFMNTHIVNEIE